MSNDQTILLTENCGPLTNTISYKINNGQIEREEPQRTIRVSLVKYILNFFRVILLPIGYPNSVSDDYFEYQLWDSIQAFCSTITGIFTTQAILRGVGVGNAEASALSATITWIMKDGTGMIGRIIFTWWKGNNLDGDCKKWRLFADFLNDAAMLLELSLPLIGNVSTLILCLSTTMKSVVGVAGGATRASITHHQAIKGNMAEISAKDGSQETLVNLIASFIAIFLLNLLTETIFQWIFVLLLISIHLYSNYKAVRALIFRDMNNSRIALVLKSYLILNSVLVPQKINERESVFLNFKSIEKFCGFKLILGKPFAKIYKSVKFDDLKKLSLVIYKDKKYVLVPDIDNRIIYIFLEHNEQPEDVISAYYHAVLFGIATCFYNDLSLDVYFKRKLHHSTPITRLSTLMKTYRNSLDKPVNIPVDLLIHFNEFVNIEIEMFFTALQINGWKTDSHSITVDEWRIHRGAAFTSSTKKLL